MGGYQDIGKAIEAATEPPESRQRATDRAASRTGQRNRPARSRQRQTVKPQNSAGKQAKTVIPPVSHFKAVFRAFRHGSYRSITRGINGPCRPRRAPQRIAPQRGIEGSAHRPREWLEYPEKIKRPLLDKKLSDKY